MGYIFNHINVSISSNSFKIFVVIFVLLISFSTRANSLEFKINLPSPKCITIYSKSHSTSTVSTDLPQSLSHPRSYYYTLEDLSYFDIQSEQSKLNTLQTISHYIPTLHTHNLTEILSIINAQNLLLDHLKSIPDYNSSFLQRKNYVEIRIKSPSFSTSNLYDTNLRLTTRWSLRLQKSLENIIELNPNHTLKELIEKYLTRFLSHNTSSSSIIAAITSFLTPELKQAFLFHKSALQNKINWIEIFLDDSFPSSFKTERFNFSYDISTKENVVTILEDEMYLVSLLVLYCALDNPYQISDLPFTKELLSTLKVSSFYQAQLLNLTDKKVYLSIRLSKLLDTIKTKEPLQPYPLINKLSRLVISGIKPYIQKKQLQEQKSIDLDLTLREVPPRIGVLRGLVGKDCASRLSFSYPNDPYERVFFIYNNKEEVLGYLSSTEVTSPLGKVLYLITLSGVKISTKMAESIIDALDSIKEHLGVSFIGLPPHNHPHVLLEHYQIRTAYNHKSASKHLTQIFYQKPHIRKALENFQLLNEGSYDHQDSNTKADLYIKPYDYPLQLTVLVSPLDHRKISSGAVNQ